MKKTLLSIFGTLLIGATFAQKRVVLIEEFTNASCPPCAAFNPPFHTLVGKNEGKLITLKYQMNYPGVDPMNAQNSTEPKTRHDYYGVTGVPTPVFDGVKKTQNQALSQATIDASYAKAAPYTMDVSHTLNAKADSMQITVKIKNINAAAYKEINQKLYVAIVEKEIAFPNPPGTNGEKVFYSVMRKMIPSINGTVVRDSIAAGEELVFSYNAAVPKYIYNLEELAVVAFVQNTATKVVNQAGYTEPLPLGGNFVDVSAAAKTIAPKAPCGTEITPVAEFTNNTDSVITSFDAFYSLNAKKSAIVNWTGELKKGEKAKVSFPTTNITAGKSNTLSYSVENINNGIVVDKASLNNTTETATYKAIPTTPAATATKLVTDFESTAIRTIPSNALLFTSDRATASFTYVADKTVFSSTSTQKCGGYGQSERAFWFNFSGLTIPGETATLVWYKLNLKDSKNTKLKFDYNYAPKVGSLQNSQDKFEVLVSSDCGATNTTLFSKQGDDLATGNPVTTIALPKSAEWKTVEADMSAFDGEGEVVVMFKGTADGAGSLLFLDNISIDASTGVGVNDILAANTLEVTPNPATDFANINLNMTESTTATVKVFDVTGKLVTTLANNQVVSAGNTQLRWDTANQPEGVYLVKVETSNGQLTKRIVVAK